MRGRLREMTESETQALCEERREAYVAGLRSKGQGAAAETVLRDWEDFVTFYHYPKEHWVHLPNQQPHRVHFQRGKAADQRGQAYTLPGECPLPGVQAGGALSGNWRVLNGGENLMAWSWRDVVSKMAS